MLTMKVLGWKLGLARAAGAIVFSILLGLFMANLFKKETHKKVQSPMLLSSDSNGVRPLWKDAFFLLNLVLILIFAAWIKPEDTASFWMKIYHIHWPLTILLFLSLAFILWSWFRKDELVLWCEATWEFAKQILPLLFVGILIVGFLLGSSQEGYELIPSGFIKEIVGGNSLVANLFAAVCAALMYFATLTEVPILQGLLESGMGQGPALALLLSGPAISLPNMLVIRSVIGTKKTVAYIVLVVIMATISGLLYGNLAT